MNWIHIQLLIDVGILRLTRNCPGLAERFQLYLNASNITNTPDRAFVSDITKNFLLCNIMVEPWI